MSLNEVLHRLFIFIVPKDSFTKMGIQLKQTNVLVNIYSNLFFNYLYSFQKRL